METITELPISEQDINLLTEGELVQVPAEKFADLLRYIDQLERSLSISESNVAQERRFIDILIHGLANAFGAISRYGLRTRTKTDFQTSVQEALEGGSIGPDQFERLKENLPYIRFERNQATTENEIVRA